MAFIPDSAVVDDTQPQPQQASPKFIPDSMVMDDSQSTEEKNPSYVRDALNSAVDSVTGLGHAVMHPIETAGKMGDAYNAFLNANTDQKLNMAGNLLSSALPGGNTLYHIANQQLGLEPEENERQLFHRYSKDAGGFAGLYGLGEASKLISPAISAVSSAPSKATAMAKFLTQGADEGMINRAAGGVLNKMSSAEDLPKAISAALQSEEGNPFAGYKSTAEVLQDPGLAQLEKSLLKSDIGAAGDATEKAAARNAMRNDIVQQQTPGLNITPEEAGNSFRNLLLSNSEHARGNVTKAFSEVDPQGTSAIPMESIQETARDARNSLFGQGAATKPPSSVLNLLNELHETAPTPSKGPTYDLSDPSSIDWKNIPVKDGRFVLPEPGVPQKPNVRTIGELQKLRAAANNLVMDESPQVQAFGAIVKKAIDDTAASGKGLLPDQFEKWQSAVADARNNAETYKQGAVGQAIRRGANEGGFASNASSIPASFLASPEATNSFIRALGENPGAVGTERQIAIDRLLKDSTDTFGNIKNAAFQKNLDKLTTNSSGLFNELHVQNLKKVAQDLQSQAEKERLAIAPSAGQSVTSQASSNAQDIAQQIKDELGFSKTQKGAKALNAIGTIGGLKGGLGGGAAARVGGNFIESALANKLEDAHKAVMQTLIRASASPEVARKLAQEATAGKPLLKPGIISSILTGGSDKFSKAYQGSIPLAKALMQGGANVLPDSKPNLSGPNLPLPSNGRAEKEAPRAGKTSGQSLAEALAPALIKVESEGNSKAVSPKGAQGLMQLMPAMQKALGVKDPFDAKQNVAGGIKLLTEELGRFKNDPRLAIAAFNAGSPKVLAAVKKAGVEDFDKAKQFLPKETQKYVSLVSQALMNGA